MVMIKLYQRIIIGILIPLDQIITMVTCLRVGLSTVAHMGMH